ncbi:hypothetical protein [Streptomyces sp. NPDC058745]|uniref:hypothetical protein n=1 Tax=Streptomyces sp. NPDC058745 TaxID=3346621 RepID=UPI0036C5022E
MHSSERDRLLWLILLRWGTLGTVSGAVLGYLAAGPWAAVAGAVFACSSALVSWAWARRSVAGRLEEARTRGYGEGAADAVYGEMAAYNAAVFPLSGPDGVTDAERQARRRVAYRAASFDGLPHSVREAAAGALAVLDAGNDQKAAERALGLLATAMQRHRNGVTR